MITTTSRLVVRPWTDHPIDLARLADLYARPEVVKFLGALREPPEDLVAQWDERMAADPRQVVAAYESTATGVVAGTVLFKPLPGDHRFEIGWHQHPDSWHHGYATEAAHAVIERGFRLGVPEVFAVVRGDNVRSMAVCRRLGMRYLGPTRRYYDNQLELFHLVAPRAATQGETERQGGPRGA
ncbi:N-acetyltransferase [Virgisporangium aliadipatigenens]|uniref:N-acetyltransferase n=1 Tax=Virgisporangium aliadipatigenens TaxID=741659 RepID=A0A8J3YXK5_9ACTN|nr:GNAT family N-acetyltransferase [Virgisporangium aliadipatigenens]GIJ51630.1 N-acetyltransferase [Virgisporangium aliadipatigenens]